MKKFLIGCGIVALIGGVCLFAMCSFVGYKMVAIAKSFEEAHTILVALQKDYPFDPPKTYEINTERYRIYLGVRHGMLDKLKASGVIQKFAEATKGNRNVNINPLEIFGFIGGVPKFVKAMAEDLQRAKMSPAEYAYNFRATAATFRHAALSGESDAKEKWDAVKGALERHPIVTDRDGHVSPEADRLEDLLEKEKEISVPSGNMELLRANWGEFDDLKFAANAELYLVLGLLASLEQRGQEKSETTKSSSETPLQEQDLTH